MESATQRAKIEKVRMGASCACKRRAHVVRGQVASAASCVANYASLTANARAERSRDFAGLSRYFRGAHGTSSTPAR
jgi:hypothetical protein